MHRWKIHYDGTGLCRGGAVATVTAPTAQDALTMFKVERPELRAYAMTWEQADVQGITEARAAQAAFERVLAREDRFAMADEVFLVRKFLANCIR